MPGYSKEARKPYEQNAPKKTSSDPNTILTHHSTQCAHKSEAYPTTTLLYLRGIVTIQNLGDNWPTPHSTAKYLLHRIIDGVLNFAIGRICP
jgi:hypothetical protein